MCGFEDGEISEQQDRIEKFLRKIKIRDEADIKHCEELIHRNYDVSLKGVRGLLRLFIKETLDFCLAKEEREKVIIFTRPVDPANAATLIRAEKRYGDRVYARVGNLLATQCLGTVFDRANWLLEIGEDLGQTAGRSHCSEFQIYAGAMSEGIFPVPDVSITCGWFCDQSPEADVLLSHMFGYPIVTTDGCNDWQWGSWPNLDDRIVNYMRKTLRQAYDRVREITGIEIREEDILAGQQDSAKITMGFMNITKMMTEADPQPVSQADLTLVFFLWTQSTFYMDDAVRALNDLQRDVHQRMKKGEGVVPKGAPRVFVEIRNCTDLTPTKEIEKLGLAIPLMFYDVFPPEQFAPTLYPDDPASQNIEATFRMPKMGDHSGSLKFWKWLAEAHHLDGILHIYPSSCRPWAIPVLMAKQYVQEKLNGLPYMVVEGDSFDSRNYSAGQLRTRVESFAEVLKMNKALKAGDK